MSLAVSSPTASSSWWHRPRSRDGQRRARAASEATPPPSEHLSLSSPSISTSSTSSSGSSRLTAIVSAMGLTPRRQKSSTSSSSQQKMTSVAQDPLTSHGSFSSSYSSSLAPARSGKKLSLKSKTLSTCSSEGPQTPISVPFDPFAVSPIDFYHVSRSNDQDSSLLKRSAIDSVTSPSPLEGLSYRGFSPPSNWSPSRSPASPPPSRYERVPQVEHHGRTHSETIRSHLAHRTGKLKLPLPKAPPDTTPPATPSDTFDNISARPSQLVWGNDWDSARTYPNANRLQLQSRERAASDASLLNGTRQARPSAMRQKSLQNLRPSTSHQQALLYDQSVLVSPNQPTTEPIVGRSKVAPLSAFSEQPVDQSVNSRRRLFMIVGQRNRPEVSNGRNPARESSVFSSPITDQVIEFPDEEPTTPSNERRLSILEHSTYLLPPEKLMEMMEAPLEFECHLPITGAANGHFGPPDIANTGISSFATTRVTPLSAKSPVVGGMRPRPRCTMPPGLPACDEEMEQRLKDAGFEHSKTLNRDSLIRSETGDAKTSARQLHRTASFLTLDDEEEGNIAPNSSTSWKKQAEIGDSFIDFGRGTNSMEDDEFGDSFIY